MHLRSFLVFSDALNIAILSFMFFAYLGFMIYSSEKNHSGADRFSEADAAKTEIYVPKGHSLMELLTSSEI